MHLDGCCFYSLSLSLCFHAHSNSMFLALLLWTISPACPTSGCKKLKPKAPLLLKKWTKARPPKQWPWWWPLGQPPVLSKFACRVSVCCHLSTLTSWLARSYPLGRQSACVRLIDTCLIYTCAVCSPLSNPMTCKITLSPRSVCVVALEWYI